MLRKLVPRKGTETIYDLSVYHCQLKLRKIVPRKGTETNKSYISHIINELRKIVPRKGTETDFASSYASNPVRVKEDSSPKGDGNLYPKLL